MKTILLDFPGLGNGQIFNASARDRANAGWIHLRDVLHDLGYDLITVDDHPLDNAHSIWVWEMPRILTTRQRIKYELRRWIGQPQQRNLFIEARRLRKEIILFLFEPPTTRPDNWDMRKHRLFPTIFTWHDELVNQPRYHKLLYPQPESFPAFETVPFAEKKLLVHISSNKRAAHPKELYTERLASIRYFETHHPDDFDLFGIGWDRDPNEQFRSYRGKIDHKWNVYPHYRFALCYENIRDEPGYVTEKMFDAMRVGCVPIYWGANNIENYVDKDAFIDRRQFADNAELARFLYAMTEEEHRRYLRASEDYLQGDRFKLFLPQHFAHRIIDMLNLADGVNQPHEPKT